MLKNAKIKEKEEEYMAEVRNHLKPHTLQLYALKELYKLDELQVPDFEHEHLNSALAGELIKKFASDVADELERHINDKGLTEDTVDLMRGVVVMKYDHTLNDFIGLLDFFNKHMHEYEDCKMQIDENLRIIQLIEKMVLRENTLFSPLDIWYGFNGDGTSSGEIASWLQEYITRCSDFDAKEWAETDEAEEVESEEAKAEDEAEEVESEEPKAESEDEWIEPIPVENTIENKEIVEINKLADDLGVDTVHSSPPCIEEALPIRTDGPIDWNWFFSAVAKSEDRTKGIAEQILALKEEGVIKTKQDFLDTMMFLFYATQTLDKETTEKIVSMFSELR